MGSERIFDRRSPLLLLAPVAAAIFLGCGESAPKAYRVSGNVSCNDAAVPTGQVTFVPTGVGKTVSGPIGTDGRYELEAPIGDYRVAVVAPRDRAPRKDVNQENWIAAFSEEDPPPYVPGSFGDPETSSLSFTVEAKEENVFDIAIKTTRRRRR